jgi:hypothetical protein
MKSIKIYLAFLILFIINNISLCSKGNLKIKSKQLGQCQSKLIFIIVYIGCMLILKQLKINKTSAYCDRTGVDKILCYELYYYLYYLRQDYFFREKSIDNDSTINTECDICSSLDKCSYSDCMETKHVQNFNENNTINSNMNHPVNVTNIQLYNNSLGNLSSGDEIAFLEAKILIPNDHKDKKLINGYSQIVSAKINHINNNLQSLLSIGDHVTKLNEGIKVKTKKSYPIIDITKQMNEFTSLKLKTDKFKNSLGHDMTKDPLKVESKLRNLIVEIQTFTKNLQKKNKQNINTLIKKLLSLSAPKLKQSPNKNKKKKKVSKDDRELKRLKKMLKVDKL